MDSVFQKFPFKLQHKSSVHNKAADALNRRTILLVTLSTEIVGFEQLKGTYEHNEDFAEVWNKVSNKEPIDLFHIYDGYMMHENQFCLPRTFLREKVIQDLHRGHLAGHSGRDTTFALVKERFY